MNQLAVVIGGSSGIGLATAQQLHADGFQVLATGVTVAECAAARELLGAAVEMRKLSTQNSEEIREAVEDGKRRLTKLVEEGATLALLPKP